MKSSTIKLDRNLFSDEVVVRAAHRHTDKFQVHLHTEGSDIWVMFTLMDDGDIPTTHEGRFRNDVLDEHLRELVRAETRELHDQLITAALREANPKQTESLP